MCAEKGTYEVTATELKQNFGKYLERVIQYNDVVITKNGTRVARLTPYIHDFAQYLAVQERARDYQYDKRRVSYEEFLEIYEKKKTGLRMGIHQWGNSPAHLAKYYPSGALGSSLPEIF